MKELSETEFKMARTRKDSIEIIRKPIHVVWQQSFVFITRYEQERDGELRSLVIARSMLNEVGLMYVLGN
jgi:hypothetical protein